MRLHYGFVLNVSCSKFQKEIIWKKFVFEAANDNMYLCTMYILTSIRAWNDFLSFFLLIAHSIYLRWCKLLMSKLQSFTFCNPSVKRDLSVSLWEGGNFMTWCNRLHILLHDVGTFKKFMFKVWVGLSQFLKIFICKSGLKSFLNKNLNKNVTLEKISINKYVFMFTSFNLMPKV